MLPAHGTGLNDARAAKRKYYLMEGVRNERLTEGGDFVLKRAKRTLEAFSSASP
ncbi:MAG TPA: hypothetical protein PKJ83_14085 [Cyclobacteriaceae bacterium]|nr:hypothetical protein [Cyclobacteriaceae bacterium]